MAFVTAGYSGPALISVSVYPARVAYLIRAGSRSGLQRAVQEATTRWGGISEVILPVRRRGTLGGWWKQVAAQANLDAAVAVDVPESEAREAAAHLGLPLVKLRDIDRTGPSFATCHPMVVNDPSDISVIPAGRSLWEIVLAGDVTAEHLRAMAGADWRLRREELPDQIARAAMSGTTAIARTGAQLPWSWVSGGAGQTPAMIWLTSGTTLTDLIWFWNLRALSSQLGTTPMILLPIHEVRHWVGIDQRVQGILRRPAEFSPDVVVVSWVKDLTLVGDAAKSLGLVPQESTEIKTGHKWPAEDRMPPFTYRLAGDYDYRWWFIADRRYGKQVQTEVHFAQSKGHLRVESPVAWRGFSRTLFAMRGPALDRLPKRGPVADAVIRYGQWRDGAIQVATSTVDRYDFDISIPSLEGATWLAIQERCQSAKLSDKGRVGVALTAESSRLLTANVYEAALELATPRKPVLLAELEKQAKGQLDDEALNDLAERWGGTARRAYRAVKDFRNMSPRHATRAAEVLCAMGWADRGFEVRCTSCGLRSFVPLRDSSARPQCPECHFPQQYDLDVAGPRVYYQLGSLADRAADQGVLPHLLVAAVLHDRMQEAFVLPGILVHGLDGAHFEIDVFGVVGGALFAGEVKTSGKAFTEEQLRADINHSVALGVDLHVMACVDEMPSEAARLASQLCAAERISLEIFDRTFMRPSKSGEIRTRITAHR